MASVVDTYLSQLVQNGNAVSAGNPLSTALAPGNANIGDVDIASIAAGENVIGLVGSSDTVIEVTPPLDTNAYQAGDLLFDSVVLSGAARVDGGVTTLMSVLVIDRDDQKQPMTLIFASGMTDFGSFNDPPNPDDTEVATVLGHVSIVAGDYLDLGGASVASPPGGIGKMLRAPNGSTSLALAAVTTGAPTHSATGLTIRLGFMRS